jgi:hypothetical protein
MKITNRFGLPEAIVLAVERDTYTGGGDITCTTLIDSPQIRVLGRKHKDEMEVDCSQMVFALMGQALHTVLERAGLKEGGVTVEQRLFAEVNGWQVSGQVDRMHVSAGKLSDFKHTTVYKRHGNDSWTRQLNVLRWLAHMNGVELTQLEVVAVFRDWKKRDAQRNPDYPQAPIMTIPVPLWSLDDAEEYVRERVYLHQAASRGEEVPCTDEDRWFSGNTYALMKTGVKRALKVSTDRSALPEPTEGQYVEQRPGEYKRCDSFCDVQAYCTQRGKGDAP